MFERIEMLKNQHQKHELLLRQQMESLGHKQKMQQSERGRPRLPMTLNQASHGNLGTLRTENSRDQQRMDSSGKHSNLFGRVPQTQRNLQAPQLPDLPQGQKQQQTIAQELPQIIYN